MVSAIKFNRQAFLWGRRYAHNPEQVEALIKKEKIIVALSFDELIEDRVRRLTDYQNIVYANHYRNCVEQIRAIDTDKNLSLSSAVAKSLYKLMAYKDEYEVARLYCQKDFLQQINEQFEGDFKLSFNLAPPLLSRLDRNTGRLVKREFGGWMIKLFSVLQRFRGLRGTAFDLFGYSQREKT